MAFGREPARDAGGARRRGALDHRPGPGTRRHRDDGLERYETAFYPPLISDWQNYGAWSDPGRLNATQRATAISQAALEEYAEPPLDSARREELDDYGERRKLEIGDGEP